MTSRSINMIGEINKSNHSDQDDDDEQPLPSGTAKNIQKWSNGNDNSNNDNKEIEMSSYLEPENLNKIPLWLAPCHLVAALFQGMQALFLLAFASQTDLRWIVFTNYPSGTDEGLEEDEYAIPSPRRLGSYPITWYAGIFILMSCIDHISCIIPRFRRHYEHCIARHRSPVRWVEYSLSASLMRMHIAQVAGVTDAHILFLIFAMTHVSIYFPALHEIINARARADGHEQNWIPFHMGIVPHVASWGIIFFYFFSGLNRGDPPGFVVSIVVSLFILDMSFPTCFVLQWKKIGPFKDYLVGEFGFIMLSFTTKTILAWVTLAGANRYSTS